MNNRDRLDLMLERSAPTALTVDDDLTRAMDNVAYTARAQVTAEQPRVRRMPRLVAGVGLAVLFTGALALRLLRGLRVVAVGAGSRCRLRLHFAQRPCL